MTEFELLSINRIEHAIYDGRLSNDGMIKIIKLFECYLNPLSIQEFANRYGISYQGARKHKQTILFRQKFIIDND
jgi:hypothetical protein